MVVAAQKRKLREALKCKIKDFLRHENGNSGIDIVSRLAPFLLENIDSLNQKGVGLFSSFIDEIDTKPLFQFLNGLGVACSYPDPDSKKPAYQWKKDERIKNGPVETKKLAIIFVPGLAFDMAGSRLGRGSGYFDRLISSRSPNGPLTIGLSLDIQIRDDIPVEIHDQKVDMICTPAHGLVDITCKKINSKQAPNKSKYLGVESSIFMSPMSLQSA